MKAKEPIRTSLEAYATLPSSSRVCECNCKNRLVNRDYLSPPTAGAAQVGFDSKPTVFTVTTE